MKLNSYKRKRREKGEDNIVDPWDTMGILYSREERDRDSLIRMAGMTLRQKACIACLFIAFFRRNR